MPCTWIVTYLKCEHAHQAIKHITQFAFKNTVLNPCMLYVSDVPRGYTQANLKQIFEVYGPVTEIQPLVFPTPHSSKLDAHIYMQYDTNMFKHLWPSGLFADVTLKVAEQEFKVHKVVLSSVSAYFLNLFTHMQEAHQDCIELQDIDATYFEQLLQLIYTGKLLVQDLNVLKVLQLARYFQIEHLDYMAALDKLQPTSDNFVMYLQELNQLYPEGLPQDLILLIHDQMPFNVDLSSLDSDLRDQLDRKF